VHILHASSVAATAAAVLQVRKMLQLKESLDQRMGCVIVGPCGCGKSSVWGVLRAAMIKCGQVCRTLANILRVVLYMYLHMTC
jgi:putative ribosome biogenesis GTPase RsgA